MRLEDVCTPLEFTFMLFFKSNRFLSLFHSNSD